MKTLFTVWALACTACFTYGRDAGYSRLQGDTLVIGNNRIERKFRWNGGNLKTCSLTDKTAGTTFFTASQAPDFSVSGQAPAASGGTYKTERLAATPIRPACTETTVTFSLGALQVKRVYRVYDDCPAIACDTYLRGTAGRLAGGRETDAADRKNIEFAEDMQTKPAAAALDRLYLEGAHWQAKAVEFWDETDWNNNLVAERNILSYRKNSYRGNLLFVRNSIDGCGFFFLKEAPCSGKQLAYPGADFITEFGKFTVTGLGIAANDLMPGEWTRLYGCVTGVYGPGEYRALAALRSYQKNLRRHLPGRDEMVMMNTWGDRSQDAKVNEAFCLRELERAARLGITCFQIDDGWQTGKSPNSAVAKGSFRNIWENESYWKPDPDKYPRGLAPVVAKGKELGIEIGLWFNPSVQDDFADWEKDAETLIGLYRTYGIRVFKIDGLAIPTKRAETRLRRLFDKVLAETGNRVVFNLDATAGRRGGYHLFNEYGNIFLENRYTDWQNYYPYQTLRNLWMLSRYVPAERLQIEFLNKWRNADAYGDDPFAPGRYPFAYLFAVTLAGQPLAWLEASNLPDEAFGISGLAEGYKQVQADFHRGMIFPVGEEPSGRSWTGFQSVCSGGRGYLLLYREDNDRETARIDTWLPEGTTVKCTPVLGNGRPVTVTAERNGAIPVSLPGKNAFVLYRYEPV